MTISVQITIIGLGILLLSAELASQCAILTKEVKNLKETIQELQPEKEDEKNV